MSSMLVQCALGAWADALFHLVAHALYKSHAFLRSGSSVPPLTPTCTSTGSWVLLAPGVVFVILDFGTSLPLADVLLVTFFCSLAAEAGLYAAFRAEFAADPLLRRLLKHEGAELEDVAPTSAIRAIITALYALKIPAELRGRYIERQLYSRKGWSAFVRWYESQGSDDGRVPASLIDLAAIRLTWGARSAMTWREASASNPTPRLCAPTPPEGARRPSRHARRRGR